MNSQSTTLTIFLFLSGGLVACTNGDKDTDGDDSGFELPCSDAQATLEIPAGTQSGDVPLTVTLAHPDSDTARIEVKVALAGSDQFDEATVTGELSELATSPEGTTYTLTWDSVADLGYTDDDAVTLKLLTFSTCGAWEKVELPGVSIHNEEEIAPTCAIDITTPAEVQEGEVVVEFVLSHEESPEVSLQARYSTDGSNFSTATILTTDCDGDGDADGLQDLATSPEGTTHCLTWDSEANVGDDESVIVQLGCFYGGNEEATAQTDAFDLHNDPTPDPGEVIITEIMAGPSTPSGQYIELYSLAGHTLDFNDLEIRRWDWGDDPDSDPSASSYPIQDSSGTLLVAPGSYAIFAESSDERLNGCVDVDEDWGNQFVLNDDSVFRIMLSGGDDQSESDDTVLGTISMLLDDGWILRNRRSLSLDPSALNAVDWTDQSNWCNASSTIPSCPDYPDQTDLGTPGAENDTCN
ncbi:MAG: lamin tail domain-containing protein [Alphaproteobacteria bacterium]|nr:lamin tail domain-containing protein [Alphaproteobacteria bacterium]